MSYVPTHFDTFIPRWLISNPATQMQLKQQPGNALRRRVQHA